MATASLTDPNDLAIVKQYIYELESRANERDDESTSTGIDAEVTPGRQSNQQRHRLVVDDSGYILPNKRLPLQGHVKMTSETGSYPRKWFLRFDAIQNSE